MNKIKTDRITGYHWTLFLVCFLGTALAGTVSTLMAVYLPVAVKDLLGNKSNDELNQISAYISSVFILGGTFGGVISGIIGDRFGRKSSVIFSIACYGVFTIFTGLASSWQIVVVCRFFSGFGLGGVLVTTTTLMMEEWPQKTKAIFLGILSISIPVGIFSAGLIEYIVPSWRLGFLVGIIPLFIALNSFWLLRESGNWKEYRDASTLQLTPPKKLFSASYRSNLITGSIVFGTMLIGLWAIFSWLPTWIQSLVTEGNSQKERGISMMMLGAGGLAGGFLSGWLANAIGLRKSLILCFAASTVLSFILFKTNPVFSTLIYFEIGALAIFFGASQGVLSVYIPGLFPVNIRSTATGFCFNVGRLFTAVAVLFVGVLVSTLGGYAHSLLLFSFIFAIGLGVLLFTKKSSSQFEMHGNSLGNDVKEEQVLNI